MQVWANYAQNYNKENRPLIRFVVCVVTRGVAAGPKAVIEFACVWIVIEPSALMTECSALVRLASSTSRHTLFPESLQALLALIRGGKSSTSTMGIFAPTLPLGLARLIGAGMLFNMKNRFRSFSDVALSPRPRF